jgi:hypothetical protein
MEIDASHEPSRFAYVNRVKFADLPAQVLQKRLLDLPGIAGLGDRGTEFTCEKKRDELLRRPGVSPDGIGCRLFSFAPAALYDSGNCV